MDNTSAEAEVEIIPLEQYDLPKLIKERKEELKHETERKRQEDLRRIQDLNIKSRTGLHPLERFPKEIWLMIFSELNDPMDKQNIRKVHDLFHNLLENRLIGDILFPQIVKFEVEPFWEDPEEWYSDGDTSLPLPFSTHFDLRRVCKSLRDGIDRWFETDLMEHIRDSLVMTGPPYSPHFQLLDPDDQEKLRRMKSELENLPSSQKPNFFCRSLTFQITPPDAALQLYDPETFPELFYQIGTVCTDILDHIGDQIWHFSCELQGIDPIDYLIANGVTFEYYYTGLIAWITRMKNLKWLSLDAEADTDDLRRHTFVIPSEPLPFMFPELERMDLVVGSPRDSDTAHVFNMLLVWNPHVKIVNVIGKDPLANPGLPKKLENLPLEGLRIARSGSTGFNLFQPVISKNSWPLKRLYLKFDKIDESIYVYFRLLEKFQTLEDVFLWIKDIIIGHDPTFLQLPNLTKFRFQFTTKPDLEWNDSVEFLFSLQFLLFAKRLNDLRWKCKIQEKLYQRLQSASAEKNRFGDIIHYVDGSGDTAQSKVWNVFPWLKDMSVVLVNLKDNGGGDVFMEFYTKRQLISKASLLAPERDN